MTLLESSDKFVKQSLPCFSFFFFFLLRKVFKAGGHKILVQHLKVVCPKLLSNSAATLTNMAEMEVIRSGILSQGAVTALVEHLTLTDAHILVSILQCLTMLVGDAEARAEVGAKDDCRKSSLQEY